MVPRISELPSTMKSPEMGTDDTKPIITHATEIDQLRPVVPRRTTAPETPSTLAPASQGFTSTLPFRPRNRSPLTKAHVKSWSSVSSLTAPQMTRAHSSPGLETAGRIPLSTFVRPSSPLSPPGRHRSPLRRSSDEPYLSFEGQVDIGETISENSELDLTPRAIPDGDTVPVSPASPMPHSFPRVRRRPSSPLHQFSQPVFRANTPTSVLRTSTSSPSLSAEQFNEPYPSSYSFGSSSIPSTPTSFRSRSPSISSLETIPDSPDAELEAENIAKLKAAVDRESDCEGEEIVRRRGSFDVMGRGGVMRDKRKRWSVCGAERRGDLDLETIWED
ncbi:hypothetical protein MMC07_000745 [Pseudocyphellaria aurata]|nr:hypothetical protein [Pseudocyphellaria aurata]